ncbi:nuclear transport factor 2 family protein [Mycobacterium sp. B14F4]|uniref:nuclear transport factor 2 family protein n=1 Tax=Mycobacterium sp. B14F4 TaxID=3153565 RepID=UPI00325D3645
METPSREWLDRASIQDLIYRYSDAVTRADWKQCEAVFAPDAIWESPVLGLRYESREEFLATLRPTTAFDLLIQTPHAPVVTLVGSNQAQATTTIHEMTRGTAETNSDLGARGTDINIDTYGIYYYDLARIDEEWKFTHRLFVPFYLSTGRVTGDVLTRRSDLLLVN